MLVSTVELEGCLCNSRYTGLGLFVLCYGIYAMVYSMYILQMLCEILPWVVSLATKMSFELLSVLIHRLKEA